ncbi:MAG: hypothetical protein KatS3mg015_2812 [Fimbriimonadales bacterium]|nr:MAG: hypothetical protein KatS3mg015_2812 [Fimbriimonadales bacterium]
MNLSDFRTRVARVVGMSTSTSADLALIDSWVNEAVIQFLKDTKLNVLKASLSVTAGSADYVLDTDILALKDIWYEPANGNGSPVLEPVDSLEIIRMRQYEGAAAASVMYYAIEGAHLLMLHPAPQSSSDKIHLLYVPRPTASLAATSDSPADATRGNIPPEYHPILEEYVLWKAARAEEHKPSENGQVFLAGYERGVAKTRADLNRKAGVFLPRKVLTRGRGRVAVTPGTDLR